MKYLCRAWISGLVLGLGAINSIACARGKANAPSSSEVPLPAPPETGSGYRPGLKSVTAGRHLAAAANPLAAQAGQQILREGGSAIDAAIAMQAVLGLVEPQASGIGGGAFILYWDGKRVRAFDGRETAPQEATEHQFLDAAGKALDFPQAQIGGLSVGVPGVLRVLELVHREFGVLPWSRLFDAAIALAEAGFPLSPRLYSQIQADSFASGITEMAEYFLDDKGKPKPVGSRLRNPQFAATLRAIAKGGAEAFYTGPIANEMVTRVRQHSNPGRLALSDLANYRAREREPLCNDYKRWRVCGMPPPSTGGVAVAQVLGMLEALEQRDRSCSMALLTPSASDSPAKLEPNSNAVHWISEAERLAYADRDTYLADPDFVSVNVSGLTSRRYLQERALTIGASSHGIANPGSPDNAVAWAPDLSPNRTSTSQVVAVDGSGGVLTMTTTIESYFGSHVMAGGFFLNNELTDFSFTPQRDGRLIANRVQPGKRPRSTMAPTLVFDRTTGKIVAALGSPGGSQIIEYVVKTLVGILDWNLDVQAAINLPNFGSRNGKSTELEARFATPKLIRELQARGHLIDPLEMTSGVQAAVRVDPTSGNATWIGGADPRREGVVLTD